MNAPQSTDQSDRRSGLLAVKLKALVREHLGTDLPADPIANRPTFGRGAAIVTGETAWVLLDEQSNSGLGGALAWAVKQPDVNRLGVIADRDSGVLARRAALFEMPITVWAPLDRKLFADVGSERAPQVELPLAHAGFLPMIQASGAEPLVEYGVLTGEVRGLEVCRVVDDSNTGETRLEVGVGAHDRDAYLTMHANRSLEESLAHVVAAVSAQRQVGAPLHPLNRFGAERFLRWQVIQDPSKVGATMLAAVSPPTRRINVKDPVPCVALGTSTSGEAMVVVCSTGVDLDLVPTAVDAQAMHAPDSRLILVLPNRDILPVTRQLAAQVKHGNCDIIAWG